MIKKLFGQMLFTQIVSNMTVMICMLIDSIMIGRFLGPDAMTAYGLATPVLLIFAAIGSMLSAGVQVMCGKTMGSGDKNGTNACYSISLALAVSVSVLGLLLVFIFVDPICSLLGATPGTEIFDLTKDYLIGFIIGAPGFILAQMMVPFMQASGNRKRLVSAVIAMTVGDITFDILNVFLLKWKTLGMGLASSLSYYVALIMGISFFLSKKCPFTFNKAGIKLKRTLEMLRYGIPTVINQISFVFLVLLINNILISDGDKFGVAAYAVISSVANICYCFGGGTGAVALMLSSMFRTEEDKTAINKLVKVMTAYAVGLNLVVIVAVFLLAKPLASLFSQSSSDGNEVLKLAAFGLKLFAPCLVSSALNTTFKNYFQGINHEILSDFISFFQNFLFIAVYVVVLGKIFGSTGVWLSFICGETTTLLFIVVYVFIKNKKIEISADNFSLLDPDFGEKAENCFEVSIQEKNEIIAASKNANEFCKSHGLSARVSMLTALCIEEMANNIVSFGFTEGSDHSINIRILKKQDKLIVRIRDNCKKFDPVNYLKFHGADDPASHIGIRMVMSMTKDVAYINSMGLNNLTFVI